MNKSTRMVVYYLFTVYTTSNSKITDSKFITCIGSSKTNVVSVNTSGVCSPNISVDGKFVSSDPSPANLDTVTTPVK